MLLFLCCRVNNYTIFAEDRFMKKLLFLLAVIMLISFAPMRVVYALPNALDSITIEDIAIDDETNAPSISYIVIDQDENVISELTNVEHGDSIIVDYKEYEIDFIDYEQKVAYARLIRTLPKPKRSLEKDTNNSNNTSKRTIGLYMTHNDESYMIGDGVSSINGAGGIHDVAKNLASDLSALGYSIYLKETIHNPHDSGAYTRSRVTAKALLNENVDALFDIHRDGVARSVYVKTIDGIERCKVRIVIGKGNSNYQKNLDFALQMVSVAEEICPWLFLDIYSGKGTYNQNLREDILLFEMGTYLAEKDLVMQTTSSLAKVIDATLDAKFVTTTPDINTGTNTDTSIDNSTAPDSNVGSGTDSDTSDEIIDNAGSDLGQDDTATDDNENIDQDNHLPPTDSTNNSSPDISHGATADTTRSTTAWEIIIAVAILITLAGLAYYYVFRK